MSCKIDDLINPFGKYFTAVSVRSLIDKLKLDYKEHVEHDIEVSALKNKDTYVIYFTIPSKENKESPGDVIYYDVLLELTPPNSKWVTAPSCRDYDVKAFNNSPRFVYTFDYSFNKKKCLINLPNKFYSKYALKTPAKKRNPMNLLGIDANIYHAVMYMDKHHLFDKAILDTLCMSSNLTMKDLLTEIATQDSKMTEVTNRDLRRRAANRHKNSKVWEKGSNKAKIKDQLLQEAKNLKELSAKNPMESQILKTQMLSNLRSRLSLTNMRTSLDARISHTNDMKSSLSKPKNKGGILGTKSLRSNLKSSL